MLYFGIKNKQTNKQKQKQNKQTKTKQTNKTKTKTKTKQNKQQTNKTINARNHMKWNISQQGKNAILFWFFLSSRIMVFRRFIEYIILCFSYHLVFS